MIRIALLRLLISWWMIPGTWLIVFPLAFLVYGKDFAVRDSIDLCDLYWNGGAA